MTEFWELRRPKPKPKTTVWLVVGAVLVGLWALIAAIGAMAHPDNSGLGGMANSIDPYADLGYLAGQMLVAALIPVVVVWLLLFLLVVRRVAPERGMAHFAVLAAVGLLAGLSPLAVTIASQPPEDPAQLAIADKEIAAALVEALNPTQTGTVDPTVKATGEAGELERLSKQMIIAVQTDRQHYLEELHVLSDPGYLSGKWLAGDRSLNKSRAGLAEALKTVAKYRTLNQQRLEEFKAAVRASSVLTERHKRQVLAGIDRSLEETRERGERVWTLDAATIVELQSAIEDLARARGRWGPSGDRIVFSRQSDLDVFNQHILKIRAMGAETDQIKRDMQASIKARSTP
ncbi:putative membrane protein [Caulobacter ginsengisoli]|uniref:Membrane protein n=1 Tax=Caulobacter ginsengisoli TaxID=400775 RepID=A0ABU0IZM5_9CAUL|nr:hypothetical protein [Caulobacter ginsengisoli]MDQ0466618.1 putative membrane protein [Caulobacter ginsengisoli]